MSVVVDVGNGKVIEFPDEATANAYFAEQQAKPRFGTLKENIFGEGEIDTPGEYVGDLINSAGAGALRGVRGILNLPSDVGQFSSNLTRKAMGKEALPRTVKAGDAVDALVGEDRVNYVSPTTGGKYAGTIGEFAVGAVGGGPAALRTAATAGFGSEFLGQKAEGSSFEPIARIVGAFAAPASLSAVSGIKNKTFQAFTKKAVETPSLENLRIAKNAAYNAVDASGVKFTVDEIDNFVATAKSKLDDFNYVPDVDKQTKASLQILESQLGKELTIGKLDKLRQGLYKRYTAAPNEQGIKSMIDDIDDLIEAKEPANKLMEAARTANKKYKKSELFDEAMTKAQDQTGSSGSGGNLVNNYRAAIKQIINSKRDSRFFDEKEIEVMRQLVRGDLPDNALRLVGKLAPTGNGLMTYLNIGAVALEPTMLGVTITGALSKQASQARTKNAIQAVRKMLATGVPPEKRGLITDKDIRILLGLQADEEQQ